MGGVSSAVLDEKYKPTSIKAKVYITSLNPHFHIKKPNPRLGVGFSF